MELEVGMYVRTKYGYIAKITEADDRHIYCDNAITKSWGEEFNILYSDAFEEMVKASYNIIDLIEIGDYVNGKLVEDMFEKTNYADKSIKLKGSGDYWYNEHIKSIVTKERFESMAYKVGE